MQTILLSSSKEVIIGRDSPFVIIGEKINPTGLKKLGKALIEENFEFVKELAQRQAAWGADVLDVNVGEPGIDEVSTITRAVKAIQSVVDIPLCIDSNDPKVLEAGLAAAQGKPLVNSVSAEGNKLKSILPIVKDRGAAVIGLTLDDQGIPKTAEGRVAAALTILEHAQKIGIAIEDVVIDPLTLTVGVDSRASMVTLETIELIRNRMDVNINLGASNVSFGMPDRPTINGVFLTLAMKAGATCSITDPRKLGSIVHASDLLLGKDEFGMRYLRHFRSVEKLRQQES